jgi:hypothetical protein
MRTRAAKTTTLGPLARRLWLVALYLLITYLLLRLGHGHGHGHGGGLTLTD